MKEETTQGVKPWFFKPVMVHSHFIVYRLNYINAKDNTLTEHTVYPENVLIIIRNDVISS